MTPWRVVVGMSGKVEREGVGMTAVCLGWNGWAETQGDPNA